MTDLIEDNLRHIKDNISKAAAQSGRSDKDVCLVAVSKKQPDERIDAALAAGIRFLAKTVCRKPWAAGSTAGQITLISNCA